MLIIIILQVQLLASYSYCNRGTKHSGSLAGTAVIIALVANLINMEDLNLYTQAQKIVAKTIKILHGIIVIYNGKEKLS